jgi:hypothetical protein
MSALMALQQAIKALNLFRQYYPTRGSGIRISGVCGISEYIIMGKEEERAGPLYRDMMGMDKGRIWHSLDSVVSTSASGDYAREAAAKRVLFERSRKSLNTSSWAKKRREPVHYIGI